MIWAISVTEAVVSAEETSAAVASVAVLQWAVAAKVVREARVAKVASAASAR